MVKIVKNSTTEYNALLFHEKQTNARKARWNMNLCALLI